MATMSDPKQILDGQFLEMRWRALSLAADVDRIHRASEGTGLDDPRLAKLREALRIVIGPEPARAERVQMLFSDQTPAPE